jgi:hypothetical protein
MYACKLEARFNKESGAIFGPFVVFHPEKGVAAKL